MTDDVRQTCKVCGRPDKFNFNVPDEVWAAVVPLRYQNRVVCLACFDDFARERQVDYATCLSVLWFAGDAATFEFRVKTAIPAEWLADCPRGLHFAEENTHVDKRGHRHCRACERQYRREQRRLLKG